MIGTITDVIHIGKSWKYKVLWKEEKEEICTSWAIRLYDFNDELNNVNCSNIDNTNYNEEIEQSAGSVEFNYEDCINDDDWNDHFSDTDDEKSR
jgi:hypothetical protein